MRFTLGAVEDFEGSDLTLEMENVFAQPRLWQDGRLAEPGPAPGAFFIRRRDGKEVTAVFRRHMLDPIPQLIIQGKVVRAAPPFRIWEWALIFLPLLLAAMDIVGTVIGALAFWVNARLLRMERPAWQRVGLALAVSAGAGLVYLLANFVITRILGG